MEPNEKKTTITLALSPEILNKLEEGDYNKSKLIDKLLTKHFEKKTK